MKSQSLITSVAAALFTFAALGAVNYNVNVYPAPAPASQVSITDLPTVVVQPSAAEWRAAALLTTDGIAAVSGGGYGGRQQFNLSSSQWGMPYYSFANQFGGISKE